MLDPASLQPISAEERARRSVFVGNIPYEATEEALKEIFEQAGHVVSFRLVYDRETGKPKGYGFCEYQDTETAQSALRNLNNHDFNGRPLRVGVAAGEGNKDEMQGMQQALGGPVLESPYGEATEPEKAPEAISKAVASLPPEQMFELMKQMKLCIQNNPTEARNMLLQNPQLAYALLQAQIVMKIVDPQVAMAMLHRDSTQIPPSSSAAPTPQNSQPLNVAQASQQQQLPAMQQPPIMQPSVSGPPTTVGMMGGPGPGPRGPMGGPMPGGPLQPQMAGGPGPQPNMMGGPPRGPLMGGPGMGGPGPQGPMGGPGGPMGGPPGGRGPMGASPMDMGGSAFGMPGPMGQSPGQDMNREPPRDPRMMGDGRGMQYGPRPGIPPVSMAGPSMPPGSVAGGMPNSSRGGPPPSVAGGFPSLAGLSGLGAQVMAGAPISSQDQEKAALIMQVLQLTDQQIAMLPPDQRTSILILKEQISKSTQ